MKRIRTRALVVAAVIPFSFDSCATFAGSYSSGRPAGSAYRAAPAHVYGFHPNGQSFVYQQAGKTMYHTNTSGTPGPTGYSPYYRFDAFTAPRTGGASRPPVFAPPTYFGGRLWSPRGY